MRYINFINNVQNGENYRLATRNRVEAFAKKHILNI